MNVGSRRILIVVMFMVVSYAALYTLTYTHELTHQKIFEYYGVESDIVVNFDLSGETVPESTLSGDKKDLVYSLHAMNEVVGYHNTVIMTILLLNTLLLLIGILG